MPLVIKNVDQQVFEAGQELPTTSKPEVQSPSTGEVWKAAFQKDNIVGSFLTDKTRGFGSTYDPSFSPFDGDYLAGYEPYVARFSDAKNRAHADAIKQQIDTELHNRKVLDESGVSGIPAQIAANVFDPITVGSFFLGPQAFFGSTMLKTAGKTAAIGIADQAAREAALHPTQMTRTATESAINIGAAGILSGALGPAFQMLSPEGKKMLQDAVTRDLSNSPLPAPSVGPAGNLGAARTTKTTLEQEALPVIEKLLDNPLAKHTPNIRLATSPSVEVRRIHQQLADNTFRTAKNADGVATPIAAENAIKRQVDELYGSIVEETRKYSTGFQKGQVPPGQTLADELLRAGQRVDPAEVIANPSKYTKDHYFNVLVSGAMRNGDKSAIPEVQAVAQFIRAKALDPLKNEAMKRGLFDDVIEAAAKRAEKSARDNSPAAKILQQLQAQLSDASVEKQAAQLLRLRDRHFALKEAGKEDSKAAKRLASAITNAESRLAAKPNGPELVKKIHDEFGTALKAKTSNVRDVAVRTKLARELFDGRLSGLNSIRSAVRSARNGLDNFAIQAANDARADAAALRPATADSYLHRMWNKEEIIQRQDDFKSRITDWVKRIAPEHDDPEGVAEDVFESIVGGHNLSLSSTPDMIGRAGPLKERLLAIPDNEIADFLENDIERVMHRYVREMTNDLVFHDTFGSKNLTDQLASIQKEYGELADAVIHTPGKTEAEKAAALFELDKRKAADISDIKYLADSILGRRDSDINLWTRTTGAVKKINAARMLGGMTLAAIPDVGRLVWANGLQRFSRSIFNLATSHTFRKLTAEEAKRIGHGFELLLNNRWQGFGDFMLDNPNLSRNGLEKSIDWATSKMGLLSGMSHWNRTAKNLAGVIHADRMAEGVLNYSKLGKGDITYLAQHGIDREMASRIADQFTKHGSVVDGFHFANVAKWDDQIAQEAFANGVYKLVNHTVNTPQAGTLPRFFRENKIGSIATQFQSFTMAMQEQTLLAGMQEHDARALVGALTMAALGAVAYNAKMLVKGKDIEKDPTKLLISAIDTSGLGGIPWEVNNRLNGLSPSMPSIQHMAGIDDAKRFREISAGGALLGPTGDFAENLIKPAIHATSGDFRQRDIRSIRRLTPYQNLFYIRLLLDKGEQSFNETFGIRR